MMVSDPPQELQLQNSQANASVKKQFWFVGEYNKQAKAQIFSLKILSSMKYHLSNF